MHNLQSKASRTVLALGLLIGLCFLSGCLESSFQLSKTSRLPVWFKLPMGLTRNDVSVTLNYYSNPFGANTKLIFKDKDGKVLEKVSGEDVSLTEAGVYPAYVLVKANGASEVLEHQRMEPIFFVTDDPSIKSKAPH